jgi:hypothetical protein
MDRFGQIYLIVVIVVLVAAVVGFWFLSRRGPRGAVLAVAAVLYTASLVIQPGTSRELVGLIGLLRFTGFIGGILGIIDLVRRPQTPPSDPKAERSVESQNRK